MNSKKTFYITTPIYYPSGDLHIGHLYSTTIAWVLRNFKQKLGYDAVMLTGSDEHGQKIEQKAKEHQMQNQDYVDMQTSKFIDLWNKYNIDYDFFSRTTNKNHQILIEEIFDLMLEKKLIYKGIYQGLYSISDEEFVVVSQAIKREGKFYHPVSNHELQLIEEESYFFKINQFSTWLIDYVKNHPDWIIPSKIWNELKNNFLDKNLEDLSITRISFNWGIKVKNDPKHVVYVWLDALFNYLSALEYIPNSDSNNYLKYWKNGDEIVHVVGKEITRFHCIYWPIFLKSLDLKMPTNIIGHGWIITSEGKMSKSKGNVINPLKLLNEFNPEIIKYFLVAKFSIKNDGVFSSELLLNTYNTDLVNTIGNLVSRVVVMINKNFDQPIKFKNTIEENDLSIIESIHTKFNQYLKYMNSFEIDQALDQMLLLANELNKYIDLTKPWLLVDNKERLSEILNILLNGIYAVLSMLEPIMPNYMNEFKQILNVKSFDFNKINNLNKFDNIKINENKIIFPRKK